MTVCVLPAAHECPITFSSNIESAIQYRKSDHGNSLSKEKISDLRGMFPYMPQVDKEFMESVISVAAAPSKLVETCTSSSEVGIKTDTGK